MIEREARRLLDERGEPIRMGVLSNPGSGRNKGGMAPIRALLSTYPGVLHREARTPDEVRKVMQEFSAAAVELVALNSGDGTVQATLSTLLRDKPFQQVPLLALLRGGSTNVNIGDVGIRGNQKSGLGRLLDWVDGRQASVNLIQRPVLQVTAHPQATPLFGMLFGAGLITKGIEYYHANVHNKGVYDGLATGITTLRMLLATARGDPKYSTPLFANLDFDTEATSESQATEEYLLVLVSALQRLFLGMHPFWGDGPGALHFTSVRSRPSHLLRALPSLVRGRPNQLGTEQNGYQSRRFDTLRISMEGQFTLDGELYTAAPEIGPISVSQAGPVTFVRV